MSVNSINRLLLVFAFSIVLVNGFQLFVPTGPIGNRMCGKFKVCPNGTVCMRLYNRQSPFSCFMPQFTDSSAFLPPEDDLTTFRTTTTDAPKNLTSDVVKMIELPGCKCPKEVDMEQQCWSNNFLSILFLFTVLALLVCVPLFTICNNRRRKFETF